MRILAELHEKGAGISESEKVKNKYEKRRAARAVLFDKNNRIALLFVSKHNYYKLPSGGLKADEDTQTALKREIKEETGCDIDVEKENGSVVENRNKFEIKQTSFCFLAKAKRKDEPHFEQGEIEDGFQLQWVDINKAIYLLKNSQPDTYDGKFIIKRDLIFLKKAKDLM